MEDGAVKVEEEGGKFYVSAHGTRQMQTPTREDAERISAFLNGLSAAGGMPWSEAVRMFEGKDGEEKTK